MRKLILGLLLSLTLMISGCAVNSQIHPGAINAADSRMYDTLLVSQASVEGAKKQYTDCQATPQDAYCEGILQHKAELNQAIASYDTAHDLYVAYHAGASADLAGVQIAVAQAIQDIAAVQKTFGKTVTK